PLPLFDADDPALAIDVRKAQMERLTDAKPARVEGHHDRPVFEIADGGEESNELLLTEDLGEPPSGLVVRNAAFDVPVSVEGHQVEESEGCRDDVEVAPRDPLISEKVVLVLLDMLDRKFVRRSLEEAGEISNVTQVNSAREYAVAAD